MSFAFAASARAEIRQRFCFTNDRAEIPVSEQIVAHLMTARENRRGREIKPVVLQIGEAGLRVGNVERPAGQEFIEEPGAAVRNAGRGAAHEGGDGIRRGSVEDAF